MKNSILTSKVTELTCWIFEEMFPQNKPEELKFLQYCLLYTIDLWDDAEKQSS